MLSSIAVRFLCQVKASRLFFLFTRWRPYVLTMASSLFGEPPSWSAQPPTSNPVKPIFIRQPMDDVALCPDKARGNVAIVLPKAQNILTHFTSLTSLRIKINLQNMSLFSSFYVLCTYVLFYCKYCKNLSSYAEVKTKSPTLICFLVYLFIVDSTCIIGSRVLGYLAQYYYSGFNGYSIVKV